MAFQGPKRRVRTIFISDLHLGSPHRQAEAALHFLRHHTADQIYLIGDIVDGWELARRVRWRDTDTQVITRLAEMAAAGTSVFFAPGNHDEVFRDERMAPMLERFAKACGVSEVCRHFVFCGADGRRFLVTHGDQFDIVEQSAKWLSKAAGLVYHFALSANRGLNSLLGRRIRHGDYDLCAHIKGTIKRAIRFLSVFESSVLELALSNDCQGVICGHIHTPAIKTAGNLIYCNTGDWVENCTAIVERFDGTLELLHHFEAARPQQPITSPAIYTSENAVSKTKSVATHSTVST